MLSNPSNPFIIEEDHRPWGFYRVIADDPDAKVKRIVVYPGKRLSLQRHRQRSEHWFILQGHGVVTLGNSTLHLQPGGSVDIPQGSLHRIENGGDENLVFIEVQTGSYLGEDDIERVEDDYGRIL